jgi:hypothetical protein
MRLKLEYLCTKRAYNSNLNHTDINKEHSCCRCALPSTQFHSHGRLKDHVNKHRNGHGFHSSRQSYTNISMYVLIDQIHCGQGLTYPDQENSWPGSATSGIGNAISGRFCTLGGGIPIFCPSGNGDILGAIGCSTGTSNQDEAAAKAGRDAVLALIRKEKLDKERRVENERQAVLTLWKEKEEEVGTLREELERGSKRMRYDEYGRKGSIALSNSGSLSGRNVMPDTPPEDGEISIQPSFVGEVALGRA